MPRPWYVLSFSLVTLACDDTATEPGTAPSDRSPVMAVASNTWRSRANMPSDRRFVITATVNPGSGGSFLYAIGGQSMNSTDFCSGSLSKVQAYDGNSNTWSSKAPLPIPVLRSLAGVINGKIYVAGGCNGPNRPLNTLYVYDVAANRWSGKALPPMSLPSPVGAVVGGKLYVYDDCSFDACDVDTTATTRLEQVTFFGFYDPATNRWTRLPLPPLFPIAGASFNDKLYFLDSNGQVHIYNPGTRAWTTGALRSGSIQGLRTTAPAGSKWYLVGSTFLSVYDPATNAWAERAAPPAAYIADNSNGPTAGRVVVGGIGRLELVGGAAPHNWQYTP